MMDALSEAEQIARMSQALALAEVDGDRAALDAALAPAFTATGSDGRVWSRSAFLDRARGRRLGGLDRGEVEVAVQGDVALVTCVDVARTPPTAARGGARLRTRLTFARTDGTWRLAGLNRTAILSQPRTRRHRVRLLVSWLVAAGALFFLVVAALHLGVRIPLGAATLGETPLGAAGIAESVIGLALASAAFGLFAHGHCRHARTAWRWAVGAAWFAVFGTLFGLVVVSGGAGAAVHTNVVEHAGMLALVVPALAALQSPAGRAAVRADALAEL